MARKRHSPESIAAVLRKVESGRPIAQLARQAGVHENTEHTRLTLRAGLMTEATPGPIECVRRKKSRLVFEKQQAASGHCPAPSAGVPTKEGAIVINMPEYFSVHAPWLAAVADQYCATLGDAAPYPFLGTAMALVKERLLLDAGSPTLSQDLQVFFNAVEAILTSDDGDARDQVYLEVIESLYGLPEDSFFRYLGPKSRVEWLSLCEAMRRAGR